MGIKGGITHNTRYNDTFGMMLRILCIWFSLTLLCTRGFAQDPLYFTIGDKTLVNVDIYSLFYDNLDEVLYVGTNRGLFAYKQNRFIELKGPKATIGSSFFQLQQDIDGHIYCANYSGQLFKISGNTYELIYQMPDDYVSNAFEYYIDGRDLILNGRGIIKIGPEGIDTLLTLADRAKPEKYSKVLPRQSEEIDKMALQSLRVVFYDSCFNALEAGKIVQVKLDKLPGNVEVCESLIKVGDKYFVYNSVENRGVYDLETGKKSDVIIKRNERAVQLTDGSFCTIGVKHGFRTFKQQGDGIVENRSFFKSRFISTVYQDKQGVLYLGTFGEGVIVVPNPDIIINQTEELCLGIVADHDSAAYICTRSGLIFETDGSSSKIIQREKGNVDKIYLVDQDFDALKKHKAKYSFNQNIGLRTYSSQIKDLWVIDSTFLLVAGNGLVAVMTNSKAELQQTNFYFSGENEALTYLIKGGERAFSVAFSKVDSTIFYSTNFGVFQRPWDQPEIVHLYYDGGTFLGNDLTVYEGNLVCGTNGHGVLFFDETECYKAINTSVGLKSNTIKKLEIHDGILYILSSSGLQLYDLANDNWINLSLTAGVEHMVKDFSCSENKIWLMRKHGYYSIPKQFNSPDIIVPELYIDSVTINHEWVDFSNPLKLEYDENAITIYFDYRDILSKKEVELVYKLDGFSDDWRSISAYENEIEYQSLPPGNYTFYMDAIYKGQRSHMAEYSFKILPPFWERWWFYLGMAVFGGMVIALFSVFRIRQLRERSEQEIRHKIMEKNTIDAQLKALRAQMNPHFIFNAINSIQDLVLQNETLKSYDYLVVFSQLVRKTLDYSEKELIPLAEEVHYTEIYLSLEKLRFKDDFEYVIENEVNVQTNIPTLIVQPFIENAIKHGLLHKTGKKKLKVRYYWDEQLICEIEDNGIGRAESGVIKSRQKKSHQSFSTDSIRKRLEILDKQYPQPVDFIIKDLVSNQGEPIGTKVIIRLPDATEPTNLN